MLAGRLRVSIGLYDPPYWSALSVIATRTFLVVPIVTLLVALTLTFVSLLFSSISLCITPPLTRLVAYSPRTQSRLLPYRVY